MFKILLKRKWRKRLLIVYLISCIYFLICNSANIKKENLRLTNYTEDIEKKYNATQEVLANLDEYYPGLGSGAEEIIKAFLDEDYDKGKIAQPLIDNIVKVSTKLHGLVLYTERFNDFIFPIPMEVKEYAVVTSEFVDTRKVEYGYWKKKHNKILYGYSEEDKKIMYGDKEYKLNGEWVVTDKEGNGIRYETHYAIDIGSSYGDDIVASADGMVERCGWTDAGGYYILIRHYTKNNKIKYSYYGHLSSIKVIKDQIAGQGEIIGAMGQTGDEQTGKHVHFAIFWYDNKTKQCIYDNPTTTTTFYGRRIKDSSIKK